MIIRKEIDLDEKLADEEVRAIKALSKKPIRFDEDSPELTDEQLKQFRRVSKERRKSRQKQNVTIRLSPNSLEKARALGKGYTSVLARILENALNDKDIIEKYL